jgi:hypothetical protein
VKIDLSAAAPVWTMEYAGSPYSAVPTYQQMDDGKLEYYFDGLPTSRHTYYANHFIGKRNRVMMFYNGSSYGGISYAFGTVEGYRIGDKKYDPAGTWPASTIYSGYGANARVPTAAKHPVTEDVYLSNNGVWRKWTQATGLWSDLAPISVSFPTWQAHGSVIDGARNRWCSFVNATMQCIDLATQVGSTKPVTGDPNFAAHAAVDQSTNSGLVHDLDNDRYLLFLGSKYDGVVQVPGRLYAINPETAVATKIADIPAAANGVLTKVAYFQALGGVAYLPEYNSNILFMPTR